MGRARSARVLVTGGAGFIGSHLVERLVARGDVVTVVDDFRNSSPENLSAVAGDVRVERGDCARAAGLIRDERFDLVFHLAAPAYVPPSVDDPIEDLRANAEQTLLILEAVRRTAHRPRLVHASSAAVYGSPAIQPIREDCPPAPVSPYGVDKFCAEEHVRVAASLHGLRATILRYFSVYGPRQRKQVVYDLGQKIEASPARIEVFGTGEELRDLVHVDDVVEATLLAAERAPGRGEAYNVASGRMCSIAELVRAVARAMGAAPQVDYTGAVRPGDPQRIVADIARLRALGFEPKVRLEDGIARALAWGTGVAPVVDVPASGNANTPVPGGATEAVA